MNATVPKSGPGEGAEVEDPKKQEAAPQEDAELSSEELAQKKAAEVAATKRETAGQTDAVRADVELMRGTQGATPAAGAETKEPETGNKTWWGTLLGGVSMASAKITEIFKTLGKSITDGLSKLFGKTKKEGQETVESVQEEAKTLIRNLTDLLKPDAPVFTFLSGKSPRLTSGFGHRDDPLGEGKNTHGGVDITLGEGNTDIGEPIIATRSMKVVRVDSSSGGGDAVTLQDPENPEMTYTFRHLEEKPPFEKGDVLVAGQEIAKIGNTGARTTGAHLHFEARKDGEKIDPIQYSGLA